MAVYNLVNFSFFIQASDDKDKRKNTSFSFLPTANRGTGETGHETEMLREYLLFFFFFSDIVDSSGLKLYYTEELRQYDAGYLLTGLSPGDKYSQIIPQKQEKFYSYGYCPRECLDNAQWKDSDKMRPKVYMLIASSFFKNARVIK